MDFNNIETQQRLKKKAVPMKYDCTVLPIDEEQYIPTSSLNEF